MLGRLGSGGSGVVHLAVDDEGRAVALKVLHAEHLGEVGRRRFAREVEVLRRLRGPHLARVLDADTDGPRPWMATAYVHGERLDAAVERQGPAPTEHLVRLGRQLAAALAEVHRAGVVHRDVTPANVLLRDGEPVLIDFGVAQLATGTPLTRAGTVLGTPGYLAPEQARGDAPGPAADVWGLGACLALAATGRAAFGTGSAVAVLVRAERGKVDLPGVPPAVAEVVRACLDPEPVRRPSAARLVEVLQGLGAPGAATQALPGAVTRASPGAVTQALPAAATQALPAATQDVPAARTRVLPVARTEPGRGAPAPDGAAPAAGRTRTLEPPAGATRVDPAPATPLPPLPGSAPAPGARATRRRGTPWPRPRPPVDPRARRAQDPPRDVWAPPGPAVARRSPAAAVLVPLAWALLMLLVGLTAVASPEVAPLLVVAGHWLLLTVSRARWAASSRRAWHGTRWSDGPVVVAALPLHALSGLRDLVGGLLRAVPLVLLAGLGTAGLLVGLGLAPVPVLDEPAPAGPATRLVVAVATVVLARAGLAGRRRAPARSYLRGDLARTAASPVAAATLLAALALACVAVAQPALTALLG